MNKVKSLLLVGSAALWLLAGCAEPQRYEAVEQICTANLEMAEAMQIAEDVLGKMHFTVEKSDAESGYIRSRPLPGAQLFEFWRRDNVGRFNFAEANLHSIRRIVELNISQQEGKLCIGCDVKTQRLHLLEREDTSRAHAYRMFSESAASMQRLKLYPEQEKAWVDLGEDSKLSTVILKRISSMLDARRSSLDIEYRESSIE